MVDEEKCIFSHLRMVNFKTFSNHGGRVEVQYQPFKDGEFQSFLQPMVGGKEMQFKPFKDYKFHFPPTMVDDYRGSLRHLRARNFRTSPTTV